MFTNIGKKIKILAVVICVIMAVSSFIGGIVMISIDDDLIGAGIATMILGPIGAWVGAFVLYGYGELIDKTSSIESILKGNPSSSSSNQHTAYEQYSATQKNAYREYYAPTNEKAQKAVHLYEQGLITEEELNKVIKG